MENILTEYEEIKKILDNGIPMKLTYEDRLTIKTATKCHICHREIIKEQKRALDHDHLEGTFR